MGGEDDDAIASAWPDRWSKANAARPGASKRRNNLRKVWRYAQAHKAFVVANPLAKCDNCAHRFTNQFSENLYCHLDSDFYGNQVVDPKSVCARHKLSD